MYIGPGQYFVITDIGRGRYQWCALLARPAARTGRYAYYAHACFCGPTTVFLLPTTIYRYAFLARPADSEASEEKPEGMGPYLRNLFDGWSPEIHDIVGVTKERSA